MLNLIKALFLKYNTPQCSTMLLGTIQNRYFFYGVMTDAAYRIRFRFLISRTDLTLF